MLLEDLSGADLEPGYLDNAAGGNSVAHSPSAFIIIIIIIVNIEFKKSFDKIPRPHRFRLLIKSFGKFLDRVDFEMSQRLGL